MRIGRTYIVTAAMLSVTIGCVSAIAWWMPARDAITLFGPEELLKRSGIRAAPDFSAGPTATPFDLKSLMPASVAVEGRTQMVVGERSELRLVVARSGIDEFLKKTPETAVISSLGLMSERVKARAFSATVQIDSVTPEEKRVGADNVAVWSWGVEAKAPGESTVTIEMEYIVSFDGKDAPMPMQSFPHVIKTDATWGQRLAGWASGLTGFQALMVAATSIVTAIIAFAMALGLPSLGRWAIAKLSPRVASADGELRS